MLPVVPVRNCVYNRLAQRLAAPWVKAFFRRPSMRSMAERFFKSVYFPFLSRLA